MAYTEIYYSYVRCLCVCVFFLYIYILNVYSLILFSKKKNNYIKNLFDKALKGDYVWLGEDPNPSGNFCEFDEFFVIKLSNPGGNFSQSKEELWFSTQNRFVFSIAVFVCHESVNKENKMLIFLFILLIFVHMNFFNILLMWL